MNDRLLRVGAPVAVAIVLLALWQALVTWYDVPAYLVPSPARIGQTLWTDRGLLLDSLGVTVGIALTALAVAIVAGVAIALLFAQSRLVEASLFPYAILLQVTPIVAIAPLIIIWVKDTRVALVICAVVVAIFPIISNTTLGLRSVDPGLADLFRMSRASRWQTMLRLRIPSALPWFFAGLRIASGLALIGAVVAEFVAGTGGQGAGLAYQILMAGIQLNVPRLFAALVLITLAGVVLYLAVSVLSRYALARWHESELTPVRNRPTSGRPGQLRPLDAPIPHDKGLTLNRLLNFADFVPFPSLTPSAARNLLCSITMARSKFLAALEMRQCEGRRARTPASAAPKSGGGRLQTPLPALDPRSPTRAVRRVRSP